MCVWAPSVRLNDGSVLLLSFVWWQELTLTDDTVLEEHYEDPRLLQIQLLGEGGDYRTPIQLIGFRFNIFFIFVSISIDFSPNDVVLLLLLLLLLLLQSSNRSCVEGQPACLQDDRVRPLK